MRITFFLISIWILVFGKGQAQSGGALLSGVGQTTRSLVTSVPFLGFAPDARGAGLGDLGVATPPTLNAVHWNNAKLPFYTKERGVSFSYTPWLAKLVNDMYVGYLSGFKRINEYQAFAASVRYFDLGDIYLTDIIGNAQGTFSPRDLAADLSYARKLSEGSGIGVTLRYLQSNLSRAYNQEQTGRTANGVAVDVGYYYRSEVLYLSNVPSISSWGVHISNLGNKITYTNAANENFIPANLRVGAALQLDPQEYHRFLLGLDLNKLLTPSPPIYARDEFGGYLRDEQGNLLVEKGISPNRSTLNSIVSSFYDAPDGFGEEMQEITFSLGGEYEYREFFAIRGGYHYEHRNKGNRKYLNLGSGFRYSVFGIDFTYLIPFERNHPLAETLRFTLCFSFDEDVQQGEASPISP
ncbi:MAG: type IX secretion system outer membrane channel protein PorV [Cytophagales bacterium]|nr:type IX secretion system outer membrane channel protein PorV [Cytophagales bacterium]